MFDMSEADLVDWHDRLRINALAYEDKFPMRKRWQFERTADQRFFAGGRQRNIGWMLGPVSDGLVDFDLDVEDAGLHARLVSAIEAMLSPVWVGRDGMERHAFFRVADDEGRWSEKAVMRCGGEGGHVEFRVGGSHPDGSPKGCQSFVLGVHPSGSQVDFLDGAPLSAGDISTVSWRQAAEAWNAVKKEVGFVS